MDVKQYPVFLTCRDKVTPLIALISWLEKVGQTNIYLLDNNSSFPPLLDFYKETQHKVFYLNQNLGGRALWWSGLLDTLRIQSRYIVSDSDVIPIEDCPDSAIDVLNNVLNRFPEYKKVGFGLKIDDLPDHYKHKHDVIAWESRFYTKEIAPGIYDAAVDTTFALYQPGAEFGRTPSLRVGHPYLARHTPWYSDTNNPSDEDVFFRENLPSTHTTNWNQEELRDWLSKALGKTSDYEPTKLQPEQNTKGAVSRTADYPLLTGQPWAQDLAQDAGRIESTQRFWKAIIEPALKLLQPKDIVEVGSYPGGNTRSILEFCEQNDARLHLADPAPGYDVSGWRDQYGDRLIVHGGSSLGAQLPGDEPEVVLVNGGHNRHKVFGGLKLIEKKYKGTSRRFPLVVLHDVRWSRGPDEYRESEKNSPTQTIWPFDKDGVGPRMHDSFHGHDARNDPRTAIENFANATDQHFELLKVPGLYGLGLLVPSELAERNVELAKFLAIVSLPETIMQLVERTEEDRIGTLAKLAEANRQLQESNKRLRQLHGNRKHAREANKKLVEIKGKLRESKEKIRQLRGEKKELRIANKQLRQPNNETNEARNSRVLKLAYKIDAATRRLRSTFGKMR